MQFPVSYDPPLESIKRQEFSQPNLKKKKKAKIPQPEFEAPVTAQVEI